MRIIVCCFVFFIALLSVPRAFAYVIPPNDGFVTDRTGVLTPVQDAELEALLGQYRRDTSNEIAVFFVQTTEGRPIEDVGVEVGRAWGVGTAKNNGILILAALQDREVTIQVGYGLEGAVPDIVAKGIIDRDLVPHFREGRYAEGLMAAIDALRKHIAGEYTADRYAPEEGLSFLGIGLFLFLMVLQFLASVLARTRSWWLGGVVGAVFGILLTALLGWWLSIPFLVVLGLLYDYLVSRRGVGRYKHGSPLWLGGGRWGGGSGRGGFGGFGGGSFGGGGAMGRW